MSNVVANAEPEFQLRSLTFSTYLPTLLYSIGQGAVFPIIPLLAKEHGASVAGASLIVGLVGLGNLAFDMPAGIAVSKWGDKGAMVAGTILVSIAAVGAALSSSLLVYGLLMFLMGGAGSFWQLARLAYMSQVVPLHQRGRALSLQGGMGRLGQFIGPAMGGVLATVFALESAFVAQAVLGVLAAGLMFLVVKGNEVQEQLGGHGVGARIVSTAVEHRRIFLTAGVTTVAISLLRQARQVFLPLWGDSLGLSVAEIGFIASMSFATDAAIFYPVGIVMDRFGRKWAAVPCSLTLGISFFFLPFAHDFYTFMAVGLLSGLGNGFGAGINQTLGADFAPPAARGEFLGVWRLMADLGSVGGPLLISAVTGLSGLAMASVCSGGVGLAGAAVMFFLVPEPLKRRLVAKRSSG